MYYVSATMGRRIILQTLYSGIHTKGRSITLSQVAPYNLYLVYKVIIKRRRQNFQQTRFNSKTETHTTSPELYQKLPRSVDKVQETTG